jgi:hypothetical protein
MVMDVRGGGKYKAPTGINEWATKKANISAGCENICVYCYAKLDAYDPGRTGDIHSCKLRSV